MPPVRSAPERVTVVQVDGNSIAAVAASRDGNKVRIEAIEHIELDRLVEVTKRLNHQIFMHVNFCLLVDKELIHARLKDILGKKVFRNPSIMLIGSEKTVIVEETGVDTDDARMGRRESLLAANHSSNPYDYPAIILFQENTVGHRMSATRLFRMRLADYLPLSQIISSLAKPFLGAVTELGASARIIKLLSTTDENKPVTLCNVGKLRTLYTTLLPDGHTMFNPIPVGLARDDMHYFDSISPDAEKLQQLESAIGSLLFPPDVTPAPVVNALQGSPQSDCTRIASQISHYAVRSFSESLRRDKAERSWPGAHYLSGRGSRLPGLRQYMESKLETELRRVDRRPIAGIELAPGLKWAEVGDNLLAVGACIEALRPEKETLGVLPESFFPAPTDDLRSSVPAMVSDRLYVYEQRGEMARR
ncbi:hypothetical protein BH09SUM1_BH09SUM1_15380 [soil metagenome]